VVLCGVVLCVCVCVCGAYPTKFYDHGASFFVCLAYTFEVYNCEPFALLYNTPGQLVQVF